MPLPRSAERRSVRPCDAIAHDLGGLGLVHPDPEHTARQHAVVADHAPVARFVTNTQAVGAAHVAAAVLTIVRPSSYAHPGRRRRSRFRRFRHRSRRPSTAQDDRPCRASTGPASGRAGTSITSPSCARSIAAWRSGLVRVEPQHGRGRGVSPRADRRATAIDASSERRGDASHPLSVRASALLELAPFARGEILLRLSRPWIPISGGQTFIVAVVRLALHARQALARVDAAVARGSRAARSPACRSCTRCRSAVASGPRAGSC